MPRIAGLVIALSSAPLAAAAAQQPTAPTAAPASSVPHDSVRGAIRAIDVRARTLEVTSGVGYALRVVHLQVPASVPITNREGGQRAPIGLAALKLGDVIRVKFGGPAAGLVAYTIERLGRMETGVDATP